MKFLVLILSLSFFGTTAYSKSDKKHKWSKKQVRETWHQMVGKATLSEDKKIEKYKKLKKKKKKSMGYSKEKWSDLGPKQKKHLRKILTREKRKDRKERREERRARRKVAAQSENIPGLSAVMPGLPPIPQHCADALMISHQCQDGSDSRPIGNSCNACPEDFSGGKNVSRSAVAQCTEIALLCPDGSVAQHIGGLCNVCPLESFSSDLGNVQGAASAQ